MHGPACIFWASLTPFSLQRYHSTVKALVEAAKAGELPRLPDGGQRPFEPSVRHWPQRWPLHRHRRRRSGTAAAARSHYSASDVSSPACCVYCFALSAVYIAFFCLLHVLYLFAAHACRRHRTWRSTGRRAATSSATSK
jgi:hypothetical protein